MQGSATILFAACVAIAGCRTLSPTNSSEVVSIPAGPGQCIERNIHLRAAVSELYNKNNNYCFADDHCFNRASAMTGQVAKMLKGTTDLRGPDGKWCDDTAASGGSPGEPNWKTCDDLAFKVMVRYTGGKWSYHVASAFKVCDGSGQANLVVIDPIGKDLTERSATNWCDGWAHGPWTWGTVSAVVPSKTTCQILPATRVSYDPFLHTDPFNEHELSNLLCALASHTAELCRTGGRSPFPEGCGGPDTDGDGVPDALDMCPFSPPDVVVEYCSKSRLGCGPNEKVFDPDVHWWESDDWHYEY
jgi:hypothetical protein